MRNDNVLLPDFQLLSRKIYNFKTRCGGALYSPKFKCKPDKHYPWLMRSRINPWRKGGKHSLYINRSIYEQADNPLELLAISKMFRQAKGATAYWLSPSTSPLGARTLAPRSAR